MGTADGQHPGSGEQVPGQAGEAGEGGAAGPGGNIMGTGHVWPWGLQKPSSHSWRPQLGAFMTSRGVVSLPEDWMLSVVVGSFSGGLPFRGELGNGPRTPQDADRQADQGNRSVRSRFSTDTSSYPRVSWGEVLNLSGVFFCHL